MSAAAETGMSRERAHGLAMMTEAYGFEMSDGPGDYFAETADHLFGRTWPTSRWAPHWATVS